VGSDTSASQCESSLASVLASFGVVVGVVAWLVGVSEESSWGGDGSCAGCAGSAEAEGCACSAVTYDYLQVVR
jgi:hypothetical protein